MTLETEIEEIREIQDLLDELKRVPSIRNKANMLQRSFNRELQELDWERYKDVINLISRYSEAVLVLGNY